MIRVLVGMIASGKSTYCKIAARSGCIIVNDDSIVTMLHGGEYKLYNPSHKGLYKSIENHIVAFAVSNKYDVVIDRGVDINANSRKRWIALANSLDTSCIAMVFEKFEPEVHARRRYASDSRGCTLQEWFKVADAHNKVYSSPSIVEGFDEVQYISYDDILKGELNGKRKTDIVVGNVRF